MKRDPADPADPAKAHPAQLMLMYQAEMDLALTYSMRRPLLAHYCATLAAIAATRLGKASLIANANEVLAALNIRGAL